MRLRNVWMFVALALVPVLGLPSGASARGWFWKVPPNLVTPDSGRRNHVFFVGEPVVFKLGGAAFRYEVRDYFGELVDKGPAGTEVTINVKQPGWYKLYVYAKPPAPPPPPAKADPLGDLVDMKDTKKKDDKADELKALKEVWQDVVGGTTFVIFRKDARFPAVPDRKVSGGSAGSLDQVMRGVIGMGPQRHSVSADKADESIKRLEQDVAIDRAMYLPFDPVRGRALMVAFPGGTKNLDGVRKIAERFKGDILYWEPRNEPNFGSGGAAFVEKEMKPFYETVKAVDPKLRVMGPGTVSIGPHLQPWIEDFLKAGGAKYIDAFSFHAYNCCNGDVALVRKSLDSLNALLKKYGADKLEKWQTEQGFFACVYGSYQPRLQGRWTMVQMMMYEQYGIPKEHNHLWYDKSHGFWDFPTWWQNDDGSLNPAAPLMRVWSEELFGTKFAKAYDFGEVGNKLTVGSLFEGKERRVAAFMTAGSPDGRVTLKVAGGDKLKTVSAFGVEGEIPVMDGLAVLPVPELPVYVELAAGQTIEPVPTDYGPNLARTPGVTAAASGAADHPGDKPNTPPDKRTKNDPAKIINGEFENWYWEQKSDDQPWMSNVTEFPAWVEVRLPAPAAVSRVIVYACPPWQSQGTLLDYDLQYDDGGKWVTLEHVAEPAKTLKVFTPPTRTTVDSFFSDRWIFQHSFKTVTTAKIRLLIRECTWGGGATKDVGDAGGQTGQHQITLREIEIYSK